MRSRKGLRGHRSCRRCLHWHSCRSGAGLDVSYGLRAPSVLPSLVFVFLRGGAYGYTKNHQKTLRRNILTRKSSGSGHGGNARCLRTLD